MLSEFQLVLGLQKPVEPQNGRKILLFSNSPPQKQIRAPKKITLSRKVGYVREHVSGLWSFRVQLNGKRLQYGGYASKIMAQRAMDLMIKSRNTE